MTDRNNPIIPIIFEDDDLLVINKPAGLVVNRADSYDGVTLQDWVEERRIENRGRREENGEGGSEYGSPQEIFDQRSGIAHRLDKETSGILLIAKNPKTLIKLLAQFKARTVEKKYQALVHGKMNPEKGQIDLPIGRNSFDRLRFAVREDGRSSITEYKMIEYFPQINMDLVVTKLKQDEEFLQKKQYVQETRGRSVQLKRASKRYQGFSLLDITPHTGRTHQIRVHMAHLQHPLVGDKVYAGKKRITIDHFWCPRHFLHAKNLTFIHPTTNEKVSFEAALPADLQQVLQFLYESLG